MRNKVTNSPFTGVLLFQTSGFVVHRNTVLDSGIGIFDNGGSNNVISLNTAGRGVGISDVGILLNAKSDTVVRNSTLYNGTGIWVSVPSVPPGANRLLANTSMHNALDMRDDAPACDSNVWKANTFITSNQPCIQ
jgi:parallel beta-helix repeat protein